MSDPAILFVKPGAISAKDKKVLQTAGIIVVEVADVNDVKFVRAAAELSGSDLLLCAAKTISQSDYSNREFGDVVAKATIASADAQVKARAHD